MIKLIDKYKGVILFILVFALMLNMYTARIKELNEQEKTNIAYYEDWSNNYLENLYWITR